MQPNSPSSNGLKLEWMDPYELAENPLNPRYHPQAQRRSLHAALQSLGWLQPLLTTSAPDGLSTDTSGDRRPSSRG